MRAAVGAARALGLEVKEGAGWTPSGMRLTASMEVATRGALSLDLGATSKLEPLAALGLEKGRLGVQVGAILDRANGWRPAGYLGGTIRF